MMGPASKGAFLHVLVCFYLLIEGVYCLDCYNCKNITYPILCKTTTTCGSDESCFVDKTHSGNTFNMGCLEHTKCGNRVSLGSGSLVGKRQASRCHECCSADLCNGKLCAYSSATSCSDDTSIDCARMESLFGVCQYSRQAHDLCPRFCGLCKNDTQAISGSTAKYLQTTADPSIVTTEGGCRDMQSNCDRFDDTACQGIFESWARAHCAQRCNYCDDNSTFVRQHVNTTGSSLHPGGLLIVSGTTFKLTGVKSPVRGTCFFKNTTFGHGEHWHDTCRYDCHCTDTENNTALCTDICPHFTSLPPSCTIRQDAGDCCPKLDCGNGTETTNYTYTVNVTSSANVGDCYDKVPGCEYYEDIVCRGIYEPWARANCALRCGYCGYSPPCVDRLTYCNAYELRTACRDYPGWARYSCKKSCGLCV